MSRYVATRRYRALALCGHALNIPYGEEMEDQDGVLHWRGQAVCRTDSMNGHRHFACNDDGRGLERGALTYAIAYGDGGQPWAFSDEENQLMRSKWGMYLRSLSDVNIMNAAFFKAAIADLEQIAADLHFTKRKGRYVYQKRERRLYADSI